MPCKGVSTPNRVLCNMDSVSDSTTECCEIYHLSHSLMNTLLTVALITYASILRPILDEGKVDTHHMWVWQLFTTLMIIVPSWVPFWSELSLLLCFVIGCIDAHVLSVNVRSVVFPEVRRRLSFLREVDDCRSDTEPSEIPVVPNN